MTKETYTIYTNSKMVKKLPRKIDEKMHGELGI